MLVEHPTHTTLPVSDLARARQFYADKLGLTPESETPGGLLYRSGAATRFLLFPSSGAASGTHTQMGWTVPDIESEVAALKARGLVFEEYDYPSLKTVNSIAERGDIKSAWFKDSEGNLLGIVQFS
jgi:catechol 2,3-dioxygenase-like lactoylglutathione lyase family enzyme